MFITSPAQALYFGSDERLADEAISNASSYIAVGQVVCKLKGVGWEQVGTGTLTQDGVVITAAHIFLNPNGTPFIAPESCAFVMYDLQNKPYQALQPKRGRLLTRQFERIPERDFAFLDLGPKAARLAPTILSATTRFQPLPGRSVSLVGYSLDITPWDIRRKVSFHIRHKGALSRYATHPNIIYHDGDAGPASSGAPIIEPLTGKIIGIHLGGYGGSVYNENVSFNYGALFSNEIALEYEIFLSQRNAFVDRR